MEVNSGGALIHWESAGDGPALVLLHGNGEDMSVFRRQVADFSPGFRVITIDSRGHGASTDGETRLSLYLMAEDVCAVLDAAGAEKAHILGFSDGGNVAMILACAHPERVDRLVLSGANSDPGGIKLRYSVPMGLAYMLNTAAAPFSAKALKKRELLGLMTREPKLTKRDLEEISAPTLITAGTEDMISAEHTKYLNRCIKGSELRLFPGGHFTPFERAEEYDRAVLDFLC